MVQSHFLSLTNTKNGIIVPVSGSTASMRPTLLVSAVMPAGASSVHQLHSPVK